MKRQDTAFLEKPSFNSFIGVAAKLLVLAAAMLSRIPINIVDRFIAIFGGYGISIVYRKRFIEIKK